MSNMKLKLGLLAATAVTAAGFILPAGASQQSDYLTMIAAQNLAANQQQQALLMQQQLYQQQLAAQQPAYYAQSRYYGNPYYNNYPRRHWIHW